MGNVRKPFSVYLFLLMTIVFTSLINQLIFQCQYYAPRHNIMSLAENDFSPFLSTTTQRNDTDDISVNNTFSGETDKGSPTRLYVSNHSTAIPLWEEMAYLPSWMKEYFAWHQQQRSNLTAYNYDSRKYLIMMCGREDVCGGAADRLRPSLALIRLAANTDRLFFIYWERPAALEEFLLPPVGGLDWRLPVWLRHKLRLHTKRATGNFRGIQQLAYGKSRVVPTQYQSATYGATYYDQNITFSTRNNTEPRMNEIFSMVWRLLFTPAPAVASRIQQQLDRLHLTPGEFIGIHLRTYAADEHTVDYRELERAVQNALRCGTHLPAPPGQDIDNPLLCYYYFASDSQTATDYAVQYGVHKGLQIIQRDAEAMQEVKHLGLSTESNPAAFYDVFVDLYMLSLSHCVTYGSGGFGQWAQLISANPSCGFRHGKYGKLCSWKKISSATTATAAETATRRQPVFLTPMS